MWVEKSPFFAKRNPPHLEVSKPLNYSIINVLSKCKNNITCIVHRSSKVDTSILKASRHIDLQRLVDLRRSTHRSSKIEGGNIAPTTQHRTDDSSPNIVTTALHSIILVSRCQAVTLAVTASLASVPTWCQRIARCLP